MSEDKTRFNGFTKQTLPFLKALGFHQNREWFHENKPIYEAAVKQPMGDLVEELNWRFEEAGIPLKGSRKTSLYRVNRDVRFAKNKDPYNTHGSFILSRTGRKSEDGFLYMRFSNETCYIESGFSYLPGEQMRALRELIVREHSKFQKLISDLQAHGYEFDMSDSLKRMPRGFESIEDPYLQPLLRLRHFAFNEQIKPTQLQDPKLVDRLFLLGKHSVPFLKFGWRAIDSVRETGD